MNKNATYDIVREAFIRCQYHEPSEEERKEINASSKISDWMDSLDQVEFVMELEKVFDQPIDDATFESFKTLGGVVAWLEGDRQQITLKPDQPLTCLKCKKPINPEKLHKHADCAEVITRASDPEELDRAHLHNMYNATSTDDGHGEIETYVHWLERQLISRINKKQP